MHFCIPIFVYENLTGSPKASARSAAADKAVTALVKLISLWLSLRN